MTLHPVVVPCGRAISRPLRASQKKLQRQGGAFGIMTAVLLPLIFGFFAFAIELSMMYNRKAELTKAADVIALSAAAKLDGTAGGISKAVMAASDTAKDTYYQYGSVQLQWSDSAISFSSSPKGDWSDVVSATGKPEKLHYVKVDTSRLDPATGDVGVIFIRVLAPSQPTSVQVSSQAIAGHSSINITPLAICAMDDTKPRGTELTEYGFRRGVSYNLMQLSPTATAKNYLVNPIAPPGTTGTSMSDKLDIIKPFICTGTMAMPTVTGETITVEQGFPIGDLFPQLNSRFGSYSAPCTSATAPPDTNVKVYTFSSALPWMNATPTGQSAVTRPDGGKLRTVADLPLAPPPAPPPITAAMYGPLWLYAKAVKSSAYNAGVPEPASGYPTFSPSDWPTLYTPGSPTIKSAYPSPTPYESGSTFLAPPAGLKGVKGRRVLNIPLLQCPVGSGSPATAKVLAIAKFFMTVSATNKDLFGEFAGLAQEPSLGGQVELYP